MIKKQLLIFSVLFAHLFFAQDKTLYFDASWKETTKSKASYYRKLPLPKLGNLELLRDYYFANNNLQMQAYYADGIEKNYVGDILWFNTDGTDSSGQSYINKSKQKKLTYYFDDGKIWKTVEYGDSLKHGKTIEYKIDGSLLGEATYKNGRLTSGTIGSSSISDDYYRFNKKTKIYESVETPESHDAPQIITKILYWKNTLKIAVEYKIYDNKRISEKNYDENGNLIQSIDSLSYYRPGGAQKKGKSFYYKPNRAKSFLCFTFWSSYFNS